MSNYPSQDQPSSAGRYARDDNSRDINQDRPNREPYRDQDDGNTRRSWQQPEQHRNQPWPRNEDRENYSSAPEYGRPEQYFHYGSSTGVDRYHQAGREPARGSGANYGTGQGYGAPGANYRQPQEPSRWRDNRNQQDAFRAFPNRGYPSEFGTGGMSPQYDSGQSHLEQPGFFQSGDFSHQAGYTRSEYPEDSYLRYGYPAPGRHAPDNQQAGRALDTQGWQERLGAQRGAFGLQNTHRGRGPQGYTRSDERIKEDICERLSEHHYIDASQIRVEVNQGVVTLEGSVYDRWQKYQTEDLVDATSGVRDIQNRLSVARASQQSTQWSSQPPAPQTAAPAQPAANNTEQNAAVRKPGEKAEQGERGKPGFTGN